jgi:hypothetical protein
MLNQLSFVAYADILGFTNLIGVNNNSNEYHQNLDDLTIYLEQIIKQVKEQLETTTISLEGEIKIFSDNFLFWVPFQKNLSIDHQIVLSLQSLSYLQFWMACEGFFIRGGICCDLAYCNNNVAIGPALVKAVELEKNAIFPRLLIDSDTANKYLLPYLENELKGNNRLNKLFLIDDSGNYFLNYLVIIFEYIIISMAVELEDCKNQNERTELLCSTIRFHCEKLKKHKKKIEEGLKVNKEEPAIYSKYIWLRDYHNFFCSYIDGDYVPESEIIIECQNSRQFSHCYPITYSMFL